MSAEVWYLVFVFVMVAVGLWFANWLVKWLMAQDEGDAAMQAVSSFIREGADAFLKTQYTVVAYFAAALAVIVFFIYIFLRDAEAEDLDISNTTMAFITSIAFLLGALCSGFSGWCGMWVSVRTNVRGAAAAKVGADEAIKVCLRGGAFSGMLIVSLSLFGVALLYTLVRLIWSDIPMVHAPSLIVGYGFGASFVALFAQLGGGIYTKAADVGADIVGKIDLDIPEDDPRNPAVIADLVGDNVGDCAGRGADLFESTAAENIGAMILGASVVTHCANVASPASFILYPLFCRSLGLIATIVGVLFVRSKPVAPKPQEQQKLLEEGREEGSVDSEEDEDPINSLNRGYFTALAIASVLIFIASYIALQSTDQSHTWWHYGICGLIGILLSLVFVFITEYYTDCDHRPVQDIAAASVQGHGTNIIAGLAVGLESTGVPTLCIVTALLSSFWLGSSSGLSDKPVAGIYGTACATMGMLASVGYILAMDTFGPISDNAGGIAEMAHCHESVRRRVDRLDAVGNTTKALTKGYAVGSAALASFLLFSAFLDSVAEYTGDESIKVVDLAIPEIFVGGFVGVCLVFFFSALAIKAVGTTAQLIVVEVRRQFEEKPGIMNDTEKPDYGRCVEIVTRGALKEMVWPCLTVLIVPITDGLVFRVVGAYTNRPNLGAQSLAALLMCATIGGVLMGLFLNNAGGAWDNAKKLIETGRHGGKGSEAHKAAVTGDTVGDPCKDTAGPSLHVLVKLLSTITLVLYPVFASPRTVLAPTPVVPNAPVVAPAVVAAAAMPVVNDTLLAPVAQAVKAVADAAIAAAPAVSASV